MSTAPKPSYNPTEIAMATQLENLAPNAFLTIDPRGILPGCGYAPGRKITKTLTQHLPDLFSADPTNQGIRCKDYHFVGGNIYGMETPVYINVSKTTPLNPKQQPLRIFGAMCLWGSGEVMAKLDTGAAVHPRHHTSSPDNLGKIVDFDVQNDRPYQHEASARIAGTMARIWHYGREQRGAAPTSLHMQVPNEEYLTIGVKWLLDGHISMGQLQTYRDIVTDKADTLKGMIREIFGQFGIEAVTFQHPLAQPIGSLSTAELVKIAEQHREEFMLDPNCGDTAIGRRSYVYAMTAANQSTASNVYVHPASQRHYWNQAKNHQGFSGLIISPCELYITPSSDALDWSMHRNSPMLVTEKMRTVDPWLVA